MPSALSASRIACSWLEKGKRLLLEIKVFGLLMFATKLSLARLCTKELHHRAHATVVHWRMSSAVCRQISFRGRLRFHGIDLKRNCMRTAIHWIYLDPSTIVPLRTSNLHLAQLRDLSKLPFKLERTSQICAHLQVENGSGERSVRNCCPSIGQTSSLSWLDFCTRT